VIDGFFPNLCYYNYYGIKQFKNENGHNYPENNLLPSLDETTNHQKQYTTAQQIHYHKSDVRNNRTSYIKKYKIHIDKT